MTDTNREEASPERLQEVFARHSRNKSELIPVLQDIQETMGYIPRQAMKQTAAFLNIPESSVYGVATFYAQFYLTRQGRHNVKVCRGTACHVRGSKRIMDAVIKKLGIKPGETSADYNFSLERVACFGSCALAPVMVLDGKVHGRMTPQKAEKILNRIK